jgi:hypothetical protein
MMPPPPRKVPAIPSRARVGFLTGLKKVLAAPPRKAPALPAGKHVKVVPHADGFMVASASLGIVVGRRFDRGRGEYPECSTVCATIAEANISMKIWDAFVELNKSRTKYE